MTFYGFTLVVDGLDLDDEYQNAGLECLNCEVLASRSSGRTTLDFEIEAPSPAEAVLRAVNGCRSVNVTVLRIDLDLVGISDIAERADASRETARLWSTGERRAGFPEYFTSVGDSKVWVWSDVHSWLLKNGARFDDWFSWIPIPKDVIEGMNGAFAHQRERKNEGWIKIANLMSAPPKKSTVAPMHHWSLAGSMR